MKTAIKIGEVAKSTGLSQKTIRYYEDIGLVKPLRAENGFRYFRERDVKDLALVKSSRDLGFSLAESRALLDLFHNPNRSNAEVKSLATEHLNAIRERIRHLRALHDQLADLTGKCDADGGPDCVILDELTALQS